jgi:hypothetical protein
MSNIYLPEQFKIVSATAGCITTNAANTFDVISLRDAQMVWLVAHFTQAVTHATTLQPVVGISFASCATAITFSCRWWKNAAVATTDTLVAQTAGTSFACSAGAVSELIIVQIDPADVVAQLSTYAYLGCTQATSSQANNYVSALWMIKERYPQATPRTAIV